MPDLIVDLSEAYLKSKVESAFMNAASCKNVYDRSINALGSTWYIDKVQVNAVGLSSGAAATAVMQPGLPATAATELLANLKVTVTFAKLDVLKAGGTSRLPMPITLTLRLDATAGSGDLLFSAAFHSVSPAKVGDFDVEKLLKSAIPTFSEPMGLASLAGASVTVRGAAMGRLASGAVRIGVGITDATSLDQVSKLILVARWTTLWSTGGPSSPLKASDHWALLFTAGAMNALAQAQFPVVAAKLKANGINVSGAPSVKWDGASASLTVKAEGEYEVPVCPDINLWFTAKTSFAMTKPPLLVSTVCTDGGLTATGWLEAIGCGLAGLGVAGLIAGPLGDLGAIIGTIFAGVYASDKIDKNTGCTTTAAALATKDFTATRLQSGSNGLTVAGTASLAAFGKTAVTVSSNLSSGQWVNPRCAGSYKYAPISLKNTGTEPVTLCRCESHPPFEVVVGGYTYQSGAPIGEEIAPGGVLEIKALGSGMILLRTTGGIGVMDIAPNPGTKIPVTIVYDEKTGKMVFEASWAEPLPWMCSNLKYLTKMGRLPLTKIPIPPVPPIEPPEPPEPPLPFERWLAPVLAPHRSLVIWDALIERAGDDFRAALIGEAGEAGEDGRELATGIALGGALHLNVGVGPERAVELLLDPRGERLGMEAGALRIWRGALTRVGEFEETVLDVAACGDAVIAVDRHGLLHVGRDALGSIERPAVARFERLLDIGRIGEMAALKVEGSRGWLCTAGRLLALDLRPGAAAVIGDIGLEGARALTVRGGRPVVATAAGLAFIDASNPARPVVEHLLDAPTEGAVLFQGGSAYLAEGQRLLRLNTDGEPALIGSLEFDAPIHRLGGYGSQIHVMAGEAVHVVSVADRAALSVAGALGAPHWTLDLRRLGGHCWELRPDMTAVHAFVPSAIDASVLDLAEDLAGPLAEG